MFKRIFAWDLLERGAQAIGMQMIIGLCEQDLIPGLHGFFVARQCQTMILPCYIEWKRRS
jgi:hypothetical protein